MPIPEPRPSAGAITYDEILVPGHERLSFAELGRRCHLRHAVGPAHLDPDLIPMARPRLEGWRGSLGQADAAAGHLRNQRVGPDDLFLFFGTFAHLVSDGLPRQPRFHAFFGYLQVESVIDLTAGDFVPVWLRDHPHLSDAARISYRPNTLYTARRTLDFAPERSGWGVFRYADSLRLTPSDHFGLTQWELPSCFGPEAGATVSYLPSNLWSSSHPERVRAHVRGNKQELVCTGNPEIGNWAMKLVLNSATWAPP